MAKRLLDSTTIDILHQRLLQDIKEIKSKPYPGIDLCFHDSDALTAACLILTPQGEDSLHLTINFGPQYPLEPPTVQIQSQVLHPNVFDSYICIDILRSAPEGFYTPAYTLKGICIQLLSFFASDNIEQEHAFPGETTIGRKQYKEMVESLSSRGACRTTQPDAFHCSSCGFGIAHAASAHVEAMDNAADSRCNNRLTITEQPFDEMMIDATEEPTSHSPGDHDVWAGMQDLPNDILLIISDHLEEQSLILAAQAWNGFSRLIREYNIIQNRELHCFALKRGFNDLELGIGVHVERRAIQSEFDLLSLLAYEDCRVRDSVQGLYFENWLPLPLSQRHWQKVRGHVNDSLAGIGRRAGIQGPLEKVIYSFMNEVVVRLSTAASKYSAAEAQQDMIDDYMGTRKPKSSLEHASEKAVESYFHLFHLLLCLSIERPEIARDAEVLIENFIAGRRTKSGCPNLGFLLIAILISDIPVTEDFTKAIIREAITRNVVWMLDGKGSGFAELSFMETSLVSEHRLRQTFQAGLTSYRLLMFLNLMRKVVRSTRMKNNARPGESAEMTLVELRDRLFSSRGAPPYGTAAKLAAKIRQIQQVSTFPEFLVNMDLQPPTPSIFTKFLRDTVHDSMEKGYSRWAISQESALWLRLRSDDRSVERPEGCEPAVVFGRVPSFFPNDTGGRHGGSRGGGRGNGRGR